MNIYHINSTYAYTNICNIDIINIQWYLYFRDTCGTEQKCPYIAGVLSSEGQELQTILFGTYLQSLLTSTTPIPTTYIYIHSTANQEVSKLCPWPQCLHISLRSEKECD